MLLPYLLDQRRGDQKGGGPVCSCSTLDFAPRPRGPGAVGSRSCPLPWLLPLRPPPPAPAEGSWPGLQQEAALHRPVSRCLDRQGKGCGERAQRREEPLGRAGVRGVQLVAAPAAAPAGSRQGEEGALLYDFAGMAASWRGCPWGPRLSVEGFRACRYPSHFPCNAVCGSQVL